MKTLPLLFLLGCGVTVHLSGRAVPASAVVVSNIQALPWNAAQDAGSPGSATGSTALYTGGIPVPNPLARALQTAYLDGGSERYWASFGSDTAATHFLYDGWVYILPGGEIANLELDTNQVLANGDTVIYGFQCDGYSKTWDYTENAGTPAAYQDAWVHSAQSCDPSAWSRSVWHHIQIAYSRVGGNVTYESVALDGAEQDIDATVPSEFTLGWGPTLLTNLQVDGWSNCAGGECGYSSLLLDSLTISRW